MGSSRAAVVRWTGQGSIASLRASVERKLKSEGVPARVTTVGGCLVVSKADPVGVGAKVESMPGVAWVAAGFAVRSAAEVSAAAAALGKKYLRPGDGFLTAAEGTKGAVASDYAGSATSAILEAVERTKVDETAPKATFRVAVDGTRGAVGVQLAAGAGGVPTGKRVVTCLVSGGKHSSVLAWWALLAGFKVRLVHAKADDEGLRGVARLYAELSARVDPEALSLEVLQGTKPAAEVRRWLGSHRGPAFAGFHAACFSEPIKGIEATAPLYLVPEEEIDSVFGGLSILEDLGRLDWDADGDGRYTVQHYVREARDATQVIDGLGSQLRRS